jgi:hypothetical protein
MPKTVNGIITNIWMRPNIPKLVTRSLYARLTRIWE